MSPRAGEQEQNQLSIVATLRKSQKEAEQEKIRNDLAAVVQVIDRNGLRGEFEAAKRQRSKEKSISGDLTSMI